MRGSVCVRLLVIGLIVAGVLAGAWPAAAQPADGLGVRLLEAPADRLTDPRARSWITDHLTPGATISRRVELSNRSAAPMEVVTYPVAADIVDGTFTPTSGREQNELASWVTITPERLTLPPGSAREVTVTVRVPADATAGERYAVALAERLTPEEPPAPGTSVRLVSRVGIRLYLSVGSGGEPVTDFQIESLAAARDGDGRPVVRSAVTNTGGRALDFTGELVLLDGPGGLQAGPFPVNPGTTVEPGGVAAVEVFLDPALPAGPWRARLELVSGTVTREAEATLTFPRDAGAAAARTPATPVERGREVMLALTMGLVALVLFLLVAWRVSRGGAGVVTTPGGAETGGQPRSASAAATVATASSNDAANASTPSASSSLVT